MQNNGLTSRRYNYLRKGLMVQQQAAPFLDKGINIKRVWQHQIYPTHCISLDTFMKMLRLNIKNELRQAGIDWREITKDN